MKSTSALKSIQAATMRYAKDEDRREVIGIAKGKDLDQRIFMKKRLYLFALALLVGAFSLPIFADDYVEIGGGRQFAANVVTDGRYYYNYSASIYLKSEIGSPLRISAISYYVGNSPSSYVMNNQRIYLKHTTITEWSTGSENPATYSKVYEGSVTWNGSGWNKITFDTPFDYNGTDNLIVYWENWRGSSGDGYPVFSYNNLYLRLKTSWANGSFPGTSSRLSACANIRLHVAMPWSPQPENGAPFVAVDATPTLVWTNPADTACNALYFSTNQTWVAETNPAARVLYDGATVFKSYTHPDPLAISQTYYWRVIGTDDQSATIPGNVWSFSTVPQPSVIQSFYPQQGELAFRTPDTGATQHHYRVECATSLVSAAWTSARTVSGVGGTVLVTNDVPADKPSMFYRVAATMNSADFVDGPYLVIDVTGGPSAASYPVSYFPAAASVPGGITNDTYKTTSILMRLIPKGTFIMGSPEDELGRGDYETQHQVTLTKDFYIGVYEVTQKQWERVMGTWPSYFSNAAYRDTRPVERVSYYVIRENPDNTAISPNWPQSSQVHADSFMGKVRTRTGLTGLDLPTEAQWEYACRAGTVTALNIGKNLMDTNLCANMANAGRYRHNGGGDFTGIADTDLVGSAKVGSYLSNAWGLFDMLGNVMEWCLDWADDKAATAVVDPVGPETGDWRAFRYACWARAANVNRSASWAYNVPTTAGNLTGFRLAITQP